MYHHPVHKISFIAQDANDARAFGYVFGSPNLGHRFFGIKTERNAQMVVQTIRDLFEVVFSMKKKEYERSEHGDTPVKKKDHEKSDVPGTIGSLRWVFKVLE